MIHDYERPVIFEWTNTYNNGLYVGIPVSGGMLEDATHYHSLGISLDIVRDDQPKKLPIFSNHKKNMVVEPKRVTREEARKRLIAELDKALDVIFDEDHIDKAQYLYDEAMDKLDEY